MSSNSIRFQRVKVVNSIKGKRKDRDDDGDFNQRVFKKPRKASTTSINTSDERSGVSSINTSSLEEIVPSSLIEQQSIVPSSPSLTQVVQSTSPQSQQSQQSQSLSSVKQRNGLRSVSKALSMTATATTAATATASLSKEQVKRLPSSLQNTNTSKSMMNESSNIKIVNKTIEILPSAKTLDQPISSSSSSSSSYAPSEKMSNKTLTMQSLSLVLCLSILAFIRMYFPTICDESYVIAPFDGKFVGFKLRGSVNLMPENPINSNVDSTIISQKHLQNNHSFDGHYTYSFKGPGLGISIGTNISSIQDDDIRELLASYSSPITSLSNYITNEDTDNQLNAKQNEQEYKYDDVDDNGGDKKEDQEDNQRRDHHYYESKIKSYIYNDPYCEPYSEFEEIDNNNLVEKGRFSKLLLRTRWLTPALSIQTN